MISLPHLCGVDPMDEAEDVRRLRGCLDEHDEAAVERGLGEVVRVELLPLGEAVEGTAARRMVDRRGLPWSAACSAKLRPRGRKLQGVRSALELGLG